MLARSARAQMSSPDNYQVLVHVCRASWPKDIMLCIWSNDGCGKVKIRRIRNNEMTGRKLRSVQAVSWVCTRSRNNSISTVLDLPREYLSSGDARTTGKPKSRTPTEYRGYAARCSASIHTPVLSRSTRLWSSAWLCIYPTVAKDKYYAVVSALGT